MTGHPDKVFACCGSRAKSPAHSLWNEKGLKYVPSENCQGKDDQEINVVSCITISAQVSVRQ